MKSLDSIDKSFEERFDPKLRSIGATQLQDYDSQKEHIPPSKFFRIEFSTSISEETKIFLKGKLPSILDFSEKFGLQIPHANHVLRFIDQQTYEGEIGTALPKTVTLPASRLKIINTARSYEVTIILPRELNTAELIVNITRNLFSKLCGNIFFNEQILPLEFYQHSAQGQKQVSAAIPEILLLVEELNVPSKSLQAFCESVAKSYRLDLKKEGAKIRKQLISEWREKWTSQSLSTEEQHTLDAIFSEIKQTFRTNPEKFNQSLVERIEQLNTQLHFILPHERRAYEKFKQKRFPHYIRSVKNKLEEISALSGFIEELQNLLNQAPEATNIEGIGAQIRSRMKELRRDKKVIQFYVPELPQKPELKRIRQRFPLSLIKMLPAGIQLKEWPKEIKRLEKNYTESIYSKLYAALHSLSEWTLAFQDKRSDSFKESADGQRLKKLLPVLKYRAPAIKGLQSTLGVLLDLSEQSAPKTTDHENHRQLVPLDDFSKAWSYFISSILSMLYYQQSSASATLPQGFRTENYLKSILKFVDRQCSRGINHFHIVKLLWLVYEEKGTDALPFLLYCVQKPQDILRYTLHLTMRPQTENISLEKRLGKLSQYRDAWIAAYQNRLNESEN
ncbi:MAG: hypothetical protein HOI10_02415 [Deltaproteobacteria bacterium]|jgi:hypothetical protein|nr:hypothetical protein [Deltaproteobacteria bacterium]